MIGLYIILGPSGSGGLDILDALVDRRGCLKADGEATVLCVVACEPDTTISVHGLRQWILDDRNLAALPMPEWLRGKVRHYLHKNYAT